MKIFAKGIKQSNPGDTGDELSLRKHGLSTPQDRKRANCLRNESFSECQQWHTH